MEDKKKEEKKKKILKKVIKKVSKNSEKMEKHEKTETPGEEKIEEWALKGFKKLKNK